METELRREFEEKAPLIDPSDLGELIANEFLTDELRERSDSIWIYASFVNPEKGIDEGDEPSDLDTFVRVPDWTRPVADNSMAVFSSEATAPPSVDDQTTDYRWTGTGAPDYQWNCSVDEAWKELPQCVRQTLLNSLERRFFAQESDIENNVLRCYDLHVGNDTQLTFVSKTNACLCIWGSEATDEP